MSRRQSGWTLIEALVVLAVAAVVLAWAVPSMQRTTAHARLVNASNDLVHGLYLAQQTAVSLGRHTVFCAGTATAGCTGDWSEGRWIAFVDSDRDGQLGSGEQVIGVGTINPRILVSGNGPFSSALVFAPIGISQLISGAFGAGTLRVCSDAGGTANTIDLVLASTGRIRTQQSDSTGNCQSL